MVSPILGRSGRAWNVEGAGEEVAARRDRLNAPGPRPCGLSSVSVALGTGPGPCPEEGRRFRRGRPVRALLSKSRAGLSTPLSAPARPSRGRPARLRQDDRNWSRGGDTGGTRFFSEHTLFFFGDSWNDDRFEVRIEAISSPFAPPGRTTAMLRGLIAFAILAGLTCSFAEAQVLTGDTHPSTTTSPRSSRACTSITAS